MHVQRGQKLLMALTEPLIIWFLAAPSNTATKKRLKPAAERIRL